MLARMALWGGPIELAAIVSDSPKGTRIRLCGALQAAGIVDAIVLVQYTWQELAAIRRIGVSGVRRLMPGLKCRNLHLGMTNKEIIARWGPSVWLRTDEEKAEAIEQLPEWLRDSNSVHFQDAYLAAHGKEYENPVSDR